MTAPSALRIYAKRQGKEIVCIELEEMLRREDDLVMYAAKQVDSDSTYIGYGWSKTSAITALFLRLLSKEERDDLL